MADGREPGPMCLESRPSYLDDGTMCRQASGHPGPQGVPVFVSEGDAEIIAPNLNSNSYRELGHAVAGNATQLTYDAFVRRFIYEPAAEAMSKQAESLVQRGLMTRAEAAEWVVRSRNALVVATRDAKSSPLGRAISEYLKPRSQLPTLEKLQKKYRIRLPNGNEEEIFEAIIKSGARTREVVNRASFALRWAGPTLILVNVGLSAYIVAESPPELRNQAIAREAGGIVGGVAGGWAGAKLGCAGGASIGVWFGGVGAGPGCLIGGAAGAISLGVGGAVLGQHAGESLYDFSQTVMRWVEK